MGGGLARASGLGVEVVASSGGSAWAQLPWREVLGSGGGSSRASEIGAESLGSCGDGSARSGRPWAAALLQWDELLLPGGMPQLVEAQGPSSAVVLHEQQGESEACSCLDLHR
jgi:hypothetical protein